MALPAKLRVRVKRGWHCRPSLGLGLGLGLGWRCRPSAVSVQQCQQCASAVSVCASAVSVPQCAGAVSALRGCGVFRLPAHRTLS